MSTTLVRQLVSRNAPKGGAWRSFSAGGSHAEHGEAMDKWKKISYVSFGGVTLFGIFTVMQHFSHEHAHEETIPYPHMKIRTKPFPWGSKDCDLFDFACKSKARTD